MLKVLQHNTELALESWLFVFNALFMCTHQRHSIMGQRGFCLHFIIERESISHLVMSTFCDSTDCSPHQTPLSMGFSRQEYWSGLPIPSPGDLPWNEPISPALQADSLPTELRGKPSKPGTFIKTCSEGN